MLTKLGFLPLLTNLLASYYNKRSTKYLWNVFFSKDYDVQNSIPQGDPLSPIISVLYLSAALKLLFPSPHLDLTCLSYIDDFVLVTNNISIQDNIFQLEQAYMQLNHML